MKFKHEGEFVDAAVENSEFNQAQLAKKLGMTPQFLGRIQRGEVKLPLRFAKKLCELTGARMSKFYRARLDDYELELKRGTQK